MLLINVNTEGKVNKCVNKKKFMVEISRFLRLLQFFTSWLRLFSKDDHTEYQYVDPRGGLQ